MTQVDGFSMPRGGKLEQHHSRNGILNPPDTTLAGVYSHNTLSPGITDMIPINEPVVMISVGISQRFGDISSYICYF